MPRVSKHWGVLLLMLAGVALLAGCLIVPTNYYESNSRHNLNLLTQTNLVIGVTTREDVLLLLGEPDCGIDMDQSYGYKWSKVKAIWFIAAGSGGGGGVAGGGIQHDYMLWVSFDESNRVSQTQLVKHWR